VLLGLLDRLGDPLDPLQSGVPCGADRGQLSDSARQLRLVDPVALLAADRRHSDQRDAVEHREVLGHRLPGDRQLVAQSRRRATAVGEEEIDHASPGRVADRRPQVVVDPIENPGAHRCTFAVATYETALTLPFIGGADANAVVKAFVAKTKDQHTEHAAAFNAAIKKLKGKAQTNPDPVLLDVVNKAKTGLTGPAPVVDLALELEDGAAATYVADVGAFKDKNARSVTASIMGVEAQHSAILRAVKALLAANAANLIALPPDASALPGAAGSVGFPDGFFPTSNARPAKEGAVQ